MVSEGIGESRNFIEFYGLAGWLQNPGNMVRGWSIDSFQGRGGEAGEGETTTKHQLAGSKIEYFTIGSCKTRSLERFVRLQAVRIEALKGIEVVRFVVATYSSQPGGPWQAGAGGYIYIYI